MKFIHDPIDLGYDLVANTTPLGRTYLVPGGVSYPSITTVLGVRNKEFLEKWRKEVGEKEADRISKEASVRGEDFHLLCERYINNERNCHLKVQIASNLPNFNKIKPILDGRIETVYLQEAPLFSHHLGVAGRVDCIAQFDGQRSIIDFKTSKKTKKKEWIENYFIQESAYAIMWEERTGLPITQLVTIISVDNKDPQVFIEHRDNWTDELLKTIERYKNEQHHKQELL